MYRKGAGVRFLNRDFEEGAEMVIFGVIDKFLKMHGVKFKSILILVVNCKMVQV